MPTTPPKLYDGERLEIVQGRPVLFRYTPASPPQTARREQPLMVFVPGACHLARIAYGGHIGSRPSDFLTFWLSRAGFNVVAISYPLECLSSILPPTHADIGMPEWGDLTAQTVRMVIEKEGLQPEAIPLGWSMGGKILKSFIQAAEQRGISVPLFISLAATPGGITGVRSYPTANRTEAGYASSPGIEHKFLSQISEQERLNDSRPIIQRDIYLQEYYGHTPIRLANWGLTYTPSGTFIQDEWEALRDAGPEQSDYARYPYIGVIHGTAPSDLRHVLADRATWAMVLTYKLISEVERRIQKPNTQQWHELRRFIDSAPDRMRSVVEGNHFFFLGEKGARQTAEVISDLVHSIERLDSDLSRILETSP
ncbi:hypothetical protein CLAIMM_11697 [Cladophialophora immunda]|nr:hypothetical protein CLAIMM_11697 [Cladophialophora immunda]